MKYFLALSIPIGLAFVLFGLYETLRQHRLNATFQPVQATIKSSELLSAGEDSFRPSVSFHYKVDGGSYTSTEVFPSYVSGTRGWALNIVRRFNRDDQVTAWYDPGSPAEAYLIKHYDFMPYALILGAPSR